MNSEQAAVRLNALLAGPNPPLDRVLAVLATVHQHESPSEDAIVAAFDDLAKTLVLAEPTAASLLAEVYGSLGFVGDEGNYYDPSNSLIHLVLERRRGIPLTLASVAAELARRVGIDLRPIGMPGHVLLGEGPEPDTWYDPFRGGMQLGYDDCRELYARFHAVEAFNPDMLRALPAEGVAVRTLNNLRVAYARRGELAKTIPVLELRADMTEASFSDRLDLANLLAHFGRFPQAAKQYERLADQDQSQHELYLARAAACRAHSN